MPHPTCPCAVALDRCARCDVLLGLPDFHLIHAEVTDTAVVLDIEVCDPLTGCPGCGVIPTGHGRVTVTLVDAPSAGRPARLRWRKHRWICRESACPVVTFIEQNTQVAAPRGLLTTRAVFWAVRQLRYENASIQGLARQLGTTWNTLWSQIRPVLNTAADDPARFDGVEVLGVDEHVWHHTDPRRRGPKELTGLVDLSRHQHPTARLLDLVPGRSGTVYKDWLAARGPSFRQGVRVATLDPFQGYKNAIDDQLDDATCVLDAFHIVKLATNAVDDVRRRVQQIGRAHV